MNMFLKTRFACNSSLRALDSLFFFPILLNH